jgi:hypothetical protein
MGGGGTDMFRNLNLKIRVVLVLVLALLFISSAAFAVPAKKAENNSPDRLKVHLRADILKLGDTGDQKYGNVELKLQEVMQDDYAVKFKLDLKHASKNTQYDIFLWANIPNIPLTITGDLSNRVWYSLEYLFVLNGYDTDGTLNGQIVTSLGILEISGYHVRDTFYDIETKKNGNSKCKFQDRMTGEELIGATVDFMWPYIRLHMIGLLPALAPYLPVEPEFSGLGITSIKLHGGTYAVSTGLIMVNLPETYYTEPLNFAFSTDDFIL